MTTRSTAEILREEANAIHGADAAPDGLSGTDLYKKLNQLESAALCLSGGGIRSAAFSLGVIQALACHPRGNPDAQVASAEDSLLAKFHYLSTVSGGGYIGGFLSAWLAREHLAGPAGWTSVWRELTGNRASPDVESMRLAWLRSYSNYLTPKLGIASADLWTDVAIFLRNLFLNWLVVIPVICAVLLVLKFIALMVGWFGRFDPQEGTYSVSALLFAAISLIIALRFSSRERPSRGHSLAGQGQFLLQGLLPGVLSAISFTVALAFPSAEVLAKKELFASGYISPVGLAEASGFGAALFAIAWLASVPRFARGRDLLLDLLWWVVSGLVYGALVAVGIFFFFKISDKGLWFDEPREILLLVCGVPWMIGAQLISEMVYVGLSSSATGSDPDREWLGRAAGWYLAVAICWLLAMFLIFVGSAVATSLYRQISTWLIGGGAGIVTALLGKSSFTPAKGKANGSAGISANLVLAIAAPLVGAALVVGLSALLDRILFGQSMLQTPAFRAFVSTDTRPPWEGGIWIFIALMVVLLIAAIASLRVNINRFSLHALYRNRIVRTFLGPSNSDRQKTRNRFTDFDENDNLRMYDLWPPEVAPGIWPRVSPATWRPFHIINMALNIVSTKRLAWQERKAEPFFASPLHAGSNCLAFRPSTTYGDEKGISLGTAVAISGAAASSNMGYHSSPPLAFLMTMFNVRLGWWLGNPGAAGDATFRRDGPPTAIKPLLYEMFGQTTDEQNYVFLSDGGHFENLGLYEMVRRRCRYIVVVDAGCDKDFAFEDLGNAVRKIALDLGVTIRFKGLDTLMFRAKKNRQYGPLAPPYHAVGSIDYPAADGGGELGTILYIKPAFHFRRITNVGVRNYAVANPDFPHESTGDQWFSESQFESYRALGFEIADAVLNQALSGANLQRPTIRQIFDLLPTTVT